MFDLKTIRSEQEGGKAGRISVFSQTKIILIFPPSCKSELLRVIGEIWGEAR
jgi:hypothetical protein